MKENSGWQKCSRQDPHRVNTGLCGQDIYPQKDSAGPVLTTPVAVNLLPCDKMLFWGCFSGASRVSLEANLFLGLFLQQLSLCSKSLQRVKNRDKSTRLCSRGHLVLPVSPQDYGLICIFFFSSLRRKGFSGIPSVVYHSS